MKNQYWFLGWGLCLAGAIFAPIAYFAIDSIPLTSLGISAIIIGFTSITLGNSRPVISPEMCQLMLETGMENTSGLLEELGLKNKAVYLPSSMCNGHPRAIIPLTGSVATDQIRAKLPDRLIIRHGPRPEDMSISVATLGGTSLKMLDTLPGPYSAEIQNAMTYLLTGLLGLAGSVDVTISDSEVKISAKGIQSYSKDTWYYYVLGSPIASIAAAITSEALGKPVRINEEIYSKGRNDIKLEVIS